MTLDTGTNRTSLAVPLAGSLLVTGLFVSLVCRVPVDGGISLTRVVTLATVYLMSAAVVHLLTIWTAVKAFPDIIEVTAGRASRFTWLIVMWVPVVTLLVKEKSPWIAFLLPVPVNLAVMGLLWSESLSAPNSLEASPPGTYLWPSVAVAASLEAALLSFSFGHYASAACLFAACPVLPIFAFYSRREAYPLQALRAPSSALLTGTTLVVLLLTVLALTPYWQRGGRGTGRLAMRRGSSVRSHASASAHVPGQAFPSMILVLPKKAKEWIRPVARNTLQSGARAATQPLRIVFDGVYWFFQVPDVQPSADARVIHGDPLKAGVHSVERWPIRMEAHQFLPESIDLTCCREVQLVLTDGDTVPGRVSAEIVLTEGLLAGSPEISLGEQVLPSSIGDALDRKQVDETLTFRIPKSSNLKRFNQITVRVKPAPERDVAAPRVAIRSFLLVP